MAMGEQAITARPRFRSVRVRDAVGSTTRISAREYESLVRGINFWAPAVVHALTRRLHESGWDPDQTASLLDVGCGTGMYGQLSLADFGRLSAVGVDVARIPPLAVEQSEQPGGASGFRPAQLDFRQDGWGTGFDLVLFGNISEPGSAQDPFSRLFAVSAMAPAAVMDCPGPVRPMAGLCRPASFWHQGWRGCSSAVRADGSAGEMPLRRSAFDFALQWSSDRPRRTTTREGSPG